MLKASFAGAKSLIYRSIRLLRISKGRRAGGEFRRGRDHYFTLFSKIFDYLIQNLYLCAGKEK